MLKEPHKLILRMVKEEIVPQIVIPVELVVAIAGMAPVVQGQVQFQAQAAQAI